MRLAAPRRVEPSPEHCELLQSMGFNGAAARHALVRFDNDLDAALNLLTSLPADWQPPPEAEAPAGEAADGSAAAVEAAPAAAEAAGQQSEAEGGAAEPAQAQSAASVASAAAEGDATEADQGQQLQDTAGAVAAASGAGAAPLPAGLEEAAAAAPGGQQPTMIVVSDQDGNVRAFGPQDMPNLPPEMAAAAAAAGAAPGAGAPQDGADGGPASYLQAIFGDAMDMLASGRASMDLDLPGPGGHATGAMPILAAGGSGSIDGFGLDDMRWGGGMGDPFFSDMLPSTIGDDEDDESDEDDDDDDESDHDGESDDDEDEGWTTENSGELDGAAQEAAGAPRGGNATGAQRQVAAASESDEDPDMPGLCSESGDSDDDGPAAGGGGAAAAGTARGRDVDGGSDSSNPPGLVDPSGSDADSQDGTADVRSAAPQPAAQPAQQERVPASGGVAADGGTESAPAASRQEDGAAQCSQTGLDEVD